MPHEEGKVKMYTCGPTVYHYAHIGNLRSYIMEDVLEKYLRYVGYDVKQHSSLFHSEKSQLRGSGRKFSRNDHRQENSQLCKIVIKPSLEKNTERDIHRRRNKGI